MRCRTRKENASLRAARYGSGQRDEFATATRQSGASFEARSSGPALTDLELAELVGHELGGGVEVLVHILVDIHDRAGLVDVERSARRNAAIVEYAVGLCSLLRRIAEQRKISIVRGSECLVAFSPSTGSTLAMKYVTSYVLMRSPCSASDLHSIVQPRVKAAGNQASTTACLPLKSDSW